MSKRDRMLRRNNAIVALRDALAQEARDKRARARKGEIVRAPSPTTTAATPAPTGGSIS